jgi:deoxyribose-phosphate aldolase
MYEARDAIQRGATEIDMVLNFRDLQTRNYAAVRAEVQGLVEIYHSSSVICKIILETCYLTKEQIVKGCEICLVKTSTGVGPAGANVKDVKLMRETVGTAVGGIRELETVRGLIAAGATRIGTSSGVSIMEELLAEQRLENEKE